MQAQNATIKRYHQTLTLMGATRLASGTVQLLFSRACILFFHYPDARRVAPISACVSSSIKCYPVKPSLLKDGNPPRNFSTGSEGDFNTTG